ncbi:hypothetical protein Q1695_012335 [Nippostrongylus brasiliensis]|nr:hypothetical protein Q1695_012335 [Nippostrongylus brasiliensis]
MAGMMETAGSCFAAISNFSTAQLRFAPETFIVIAFFCITLLFCLRGEHMLGGGLSDGSLRGGTAQQKKHQLISLEPSVPRGILMTHR